MAKKNTLTIQFILFLVLLFSVLALACGCAKLNGEVKLTSEQYKSQFYMEQFSPNTRAR